MEKEAMIQERRKQVDEAVAQLKKATERMASIELAKAVVSVGKAWLMLSDELWSPPKPVVDPAWVESHIKEVRALIEVNGYPVDVRGVLVDGGYYVCVEFGGEGVLHIPIPHKMGSLEGTKCLQCMSQEIGLLEDDARNGGRA